MFFRITPRRGGKMLVILGVLWLIIAVAVSIYYGSEMNLDLKSGLILYGSGVLIAGVGALLWKFAKT